MQGKSYDEDVHNPPGQYDDDDEGVALGGGAIRQLILNHLIAEGVLEVSVEIVNGMIEYQSCQPVPGVQAVGSAGRSVTPLSLLIERLKRLS